MSTNDDKAHIHFHVDRSLHSRALRCIPWGTRTEMFCRVLEMIIEAIENHGVVMVGAVISGQMKLIYVEEINDAAGKSNKAS